MEKITVNEIAYVKPSEAIVIITKVGFLGRLKNIIINPLRYLITGTIKY